jgi:phytoene dehydrogenase-like protein
MKGRLEVIDVWTPATYKRYTGADIGSYMSFILPKKRLPIPKPPRIKGLANVYFASQWQMSPGGLPIAAARGKAAASAIIKRELALTRKLPRKQAIK